MMKIRNLLFMAIILEVVLCMVAVSVSAAPIIETYTENKFECKAVFDQTEINLLESAAFETIKIGNTTYAFVPYKSGNETDSPKTAYGSLRLFTIASDGTAEDTSSKVSEGSKDLYGFRAIGTQYMYDFVKARFEDGKPYLYFFTWKENSINSPRYIRKLDISDPYNPVKVVDYDIGNYTNSSRNSISGFSLYGDKLYTFGNNNSTGNKTSICLYDTSITNAPEQDVPKDSLSSYELVDFTWGTSTNGYFIRGMVENGKIYVINVKNINSIFYIATLDLNDNGEILPDSYVKRELTNYTETEIFATDVKVIDDYAYISFAYVLPFNNSSQRTSGNNGKVLAVNVSSSQITDVTLNNSDTNTRPIDPSCMVVDSGWIYVVDFSGRVIILDATSSPEQPTCINSVSSVSNGPGVKFIVGKLANGNLIISHNSRLYGIKIVIPYREHNGTAAISLNGSNDTETDMTVSAIGAVYRDKELISVKIVDVFLPKNTSDILFTAVADISKVRSGDILKVYVWDSLNVRSRPLLHQPFSKEY